MTYATDFIAAALADPSAPCMSGGSRAFSYGEVLAHAASTAHALLGAGEATQTAVLGGRAPSTYVGVLAAALAGRAFIPLGGTTPPDRAAPIFARTGCDELFVAESYEAEAAALLERAPHPLRVVLPATEDLASWRTRFGRHSFLECTATGEGDGEASVLGLRQSLPEDARAYIMFTSGSTGVPKGVEVLHANVDAFVDAIVERLPELTSCRVLSQLFEPTFDLSVFDFAVAWRLGAELAIPPADTLHSELVDFLRERDVDSVFMVPSLGRQLKSHGRVTANALPHLKLCLFCGEALPVSVADAWAEAAPGARLENLYGPTELTIACTSYRWDRAGGQTAQHDGVVAIGAPYTKMVTRVVDESGELVSVGSTGELLMAGPQVTAGYIDDEERTREVFVEIDGTTYYRTGDRVRILDAEGTLAFVGRVDNQIKVLGHRVELGEIEAALREVSGVDGVVAIGWPVQGGTYERILAFVESTSGSPDAFRERLSERLPSYMVPSEVRLVPSFPLNTSGKVDRRALLEQAAQSAPSDSPQEACSELEKLIITTWKKELGLEEIGLDDTFLALGGDSFVAARVVLYLRRKLGVKLEIGGLFQAQTVRAWAQHIHAEHGESLDERYRQAEPEPQSWSAKDGFAALMRYLTAAWSREMGRPVTPEDDLRADPAIDDARLEAMTVRVLEHVETFALPAHVARESTIRAQARAILARTPAPGHVVTVNDQVESPCLTLVHAAVGLCWGFGPLVQELPDFRVHLMSYDRKVGEGLETRTLVELAGSYVRALREVQPTGPYVVGGYSAGGRLAFEMARQLADQGEDTTALLFDALPPNLKTSVTAKVSPALGRVGMALPPGVDAAFAHLRRRLGRTPWVEFYHRIYSAATAHPFRTVADYLGCARYINPGERVPDQVIAEGKEAIAEWSTDRVRARMKAAGEHFPSWLESSERGGDPFTRAQTLCSLSLTLMQYIPPRRSAARVVLIEVSQRKSFKDVWQSYAERPIDFYTVEGYSHLELFEGDGMWACAPIVRQALTGHRSATS